MKKQHLFTLAVILTSFLSLNAQSYKSSIGLRLGASNGITFKHFLNSSDAIEVIAGTRWRGLHAIALYERHQTIGGTDQLKLFYGAGGHLGIWNTYKNHPFFDNSIKNREYVVIGVDGILGLEYVFEGAPIALSIDWKPEFNIIGYNGLWVGDGGLSVRYYW